MTSCRRLLAACLACGTIALGRPVLAVDNTELAKAAQNPLASMISLPFQNNTNYHVGPKRDTQNVLNIQPVYPVSLNTDWNLITRTIVPLISQPGSGFGTDRTNGLGNVQFSAFLSPAVSEGWVWGVGPIIQAPTATSDRLGTNSRWGLGPTAVALRLSKTSPFVYGALVNNVQSVGGGSGPDFNQMLIQPFVNYNFPQHPGRYLSFSPVITANWKAHGDERWTVPIGLGIGQIFRIGQLPINAQVGAYKNIERPTGASDWTLRLQVQLMFPK